MEIHQKNLGRHNLAISWEQTYRITNEMIHDFTFKGSILNTVRTRRHPCDEKNQVKRSICLNNYYMSKLNCSFPWIKEGMKNLPKCGRNDKIQDPNKIKGGRVAGAPLKETKVSLFFQAAKMVSCCSFNIFFIGKFTIHHHIHNFPSDGSAK